MVKHLTLLLFIGLALGQVTTSIDLNIKDSDKLVQSSRSDIGKYYTITYSGEFLGQKVIRYISNQLMMLPLSYFD